jgi:ATP phosphoribosyltransferase
MLKAFLLKNKLKSTIQPLNGSLEAAIDMKYADYICDLVSSGDTLRANGLQPLIKVNDIQLLLIKNKKSKKFTWK